MHAIPIIPMIQLRYRTGSYVCGKQISVTSNFCSCYILCSLLPAEEGRIDSVLRKETKVVLTSTKVNEYEILENLGRLTGEYEIKLLKMHHFISKQAEVARETPGALVAVRRYTIGSKFVHTKLKTAGSTQNFPLFSSTGWRGAYYQLFTTR